MPVFNEDEFRNRINTNKKPPVPKYTKDELEKMQKESFKFKQPTIVMKHKDTGARIVVNAKDDKKRLKLAALGYETADEARTPANERIEIKSKPESESENNDKELKISESSIRLMNKKDLLKTAKHLGIKPEGDIEEFREAMIKKIKENA